MDKKMFKKGFIVGATFIIAVGIYGYFNINSIIGDNVLKPIELTQLDLENSKGEKIKIKTGKPIVINFWATWCAGCVKELPEFEELNKKYADKIDFILVSDEKISTIEKFKARKGYTINMVRSLKTFDLYQLMLRPATYFYNSDGKLVTKMGGELSKDVLEKQIKLLLEN
jgi:thiol-disulfide isomerase/thioredoxin